MTAASSGSVRDALRTQLAALGYDVGSDTLGMRSGLYVMGENDLAKALFEFKLDVREAMETMYQGSWVAGLPPRFAVLPAEAAEDPSFELLEQARIIPLLYTSSDGGVQFSDLDRLLAEHLG